MTDAAGSQSGIVYSVYYNLRISFGKTNPNATTPPAANTKPRPAKRGEHLTRDRRPPLRIANDQASGL